MAAKLLGKCRKFSEIKVEIKTRMYGLEKLIEILIGYVMMKKLWLLITR